MYAKNMVAKRRFSGWADRRRYYRRYFEQTRPTVLKNHEAREVAPVSEKD